MLGNGGAIFEELSNFFFALEPFFFFE